MEDSDGVIDLCSPSSYPPPEEQEEPPLPEGAAGGAADDGGSDSDVVFVGEYKTTRVVSYVDLTQDTSSEEEEDESLQRERDAAAKRRRFLVIPPPRGARLKTAAGGAGASRGGGGAAAALPAARAPGFAAHTAKQSRKRGEKTSACFETSITAYAQLFSREPPPSAPLPRSHVSVAAYCDAFAPMLLAETREGLRSAWATACLKQQCVRIRLALDKSSAMSAHGWLTSVVESEQRLDQREWLDGVVLICTSEPPGRMPLNDLGAGSGPRSQPLFRFAAFLGVRPSPPPREGEQRAPPVFSLRTFLPLEEPIDAPSDDEDAPPVPPPPCGFRAAQLRAALAEQTRVWHAVPVGRTGAAFSEFRALVESRSGLLSGPLARVLCASPPHAPQKPPPSALPAGMLPSCAPFDAHLRREFNPSQLSAIYAVTHAGLLKANAPPLTLVQGPPGTGKTTTVVAMLNSLHVSSMQRETAKLEQILAQRRHASAAAADAGAPKRVLSASAVAAMAAQLCGEVVAAKPHFLVCAPSNAAVDVLVMRTLQHRFVAADGSAYQPRVVRLGSDAQEASSPGCAAVDVRLLLTALGRTKKDAIDRRTAEVQKEMSLLAPRLVSGACAARDAVRYRLLDSELTRLRLAPKLGLGGRAEAGSHLSREGAEVSMLDEADVVFTTLGTGGRALFSRLARSFDVVMVDEAAQCTEPATLIALLHGCSGGGGHVVLVGDPLQLPATVLSADNMRAKYGISLFERLTTASPSGPPSLVAMLLSTQYRMHADIVAFPNARFYGGRLLTAASVTALPKDPFSHPPFVFFDVQGREQQADDGGKSWRNTAEAQAVAWLYRQLASSLPQGSAARRSLPSRVCFLTPYRGQVGELQRAIAAQMGHGEVKELNAAHSIATVDSFQGSERDVVLYCAVRTTHLGFVEDAQRMNVAITRARRALWMLGHTRMLETRSALWASLIQHARAQGRLGKL